MKATIEVSDRVAWYFERIYGQSPQDALPEFLEAKVSDYFGSYFHGQDEAEVMASNPTERPESEYESRIKQMEEALRDRDQALLNHHRDITTCKNHVCKFIAAALSPSDTEERTE